MKRYGKRKQQTIRFIYLGAIVLWLFILFGLGLHSQHMSLLILGLVPVVLFLVAILNVENMRMQQEEQIFRLDTLSIALLAVLPMFTWMDSMKSASRTCFKTFMTLLMLGTVFLLLSYYDIWFTPKWQSISRHLRNIMQTFGLTLLILAIYYYFLACTTE